MRDNALILQLLPTVYTLDIHFQTSQCRTIALICREKQVHMSQFYKLYPPKLKNVSEVDFSYICNTSLFQYIVPKSNDICIK